VTKLDILFLSRSFFFLFCVFVARPRRPAGSWAFPFLLTKSQIRRFPSSLVFSYPKFGPGNLGDHFFPLFFRLTSFPKSFCEISCLDFNSSEGTLVVPSASEYHFARRLFLFPSFELS